MKKGANLNTCLRTQQGDITPFSLAEKLKQPEMLELLKRAQTEQEHAPKKAE